jgi:hypothetical protein
MLSQAQPIIFKVSGTIHLARARDILKYGYGSEGGAGMTSERCLNGLNVGLGVGRIKVRDVDRWQFVAGGHQR